ncbi:MAG: zinc-ribbon domain-containing protein [Actinobacteria bacterium]|nr:zinc-ribbon domain-containing protein [Actinomycetota bacterium]
MYCPECGNDADDAKFCPECGADLAVVKSALSGKTTGQRGTGSGRQSGRPPKPGSAPPPPAKRGVSPALIWGIFGGIAVMVVVIVIIMGTAGAGGDDAATDAGTPSNGPAAPIDADTSGNYRELVTRANGLYDQGAAEMPDGIPTEQGAAYFDAAAKVYEAAWAKQPGDPNVGTDWAIALFYSGNVDGAVKQVNVVLKADPRFQPGLFNKGIFLSHVSRMTQDKAEAKKYADQARAALSAAVAVDPSSQVGKQAAAALENNVPTPAPTQ